MVWLSTFRNQRASRCQASRAQTCLARYRSVSWPMTVSTRRRRSVSHCCGQGCGSREALSWPFTPSGLVFWQSLRKSAKLLLRME